MTKHILNTLNIMNIGWSVEINKKLRTYQLETNWSKIVEVKSSGEWKELVTRAIEEENKQGQQTKVACAQLIQILPKIK